MTTMSPIRHKFAISQPSRFLRMACLALLAIWFALPLAAQETEPAQAGDATPDAEKPSITISEELVVEERLADDDPWLAERATTATKIATPRHQTPMSVSAFSERTLEEQDARLLGQALENVPGVTVSRFGGATEVFFLRGFESLSSVAVLTDGTLEPEVSLYQTYNLERVEVVRGPTGFLYGGSALAGAVNLVRKRPTGNRLARFELLAGSHNTLYGTADIEAPVGARGAFRFNAVGSDTDSYRDGRDATIWAANPSYRQQLTDSTRLDLHLEVESADVQSDGGIPLFNGGIPDIGRSRSFQTPADGNDRDNLRLHIDVESLLSPRLVVRNKLWWNSLDQKGAGTIVNGAFEIPFLGAVVGRALNRLDDDQDFFGERFEAFLDRGAQGPIQHQIVAGLELERFQDDFDFGLFSVPLISLFDPVETFDPATSTFLGLGATADTTIDVIAPYVTDTLSLGPRVKLTLGLRFDQIDIDDARSGVSFSEDRLSPLVGLVVAPNQRLSLYANYGESFDPPSVTVVREQRKPEEGRQVELGVKALFADGRVSADFALYRIDKENIAIADNTGFLAQLGDQRSDGFELEITGRGDRGLHWRLAYAYTDAELVRFTEAVLNPFTFQLDFFDFSGNRPAWVPESVADGWLGMHFASGLAVGGGLRYVSSRFTDEDNRFRVDSYLTADATLTYSRGGVWTARLHLKNLTGEDYEQRALSPLAVLPADGFNLQAGIDFRF